MTKKHAISLIKGFTLVELAIVISVIAILASIVAVTYNGSQIRARNVKTIAAAEAYRDGLENYLTLNKQYPPVPANSWYCLNIAVTSCVTASSAPPWTRSTTLETELAKVMDTPLPLPSFGSGTNTLSDPHLGYIPYQGASASPQFEGTNSGFIVYVLEGTTKCGLTPLASGVWPSFTSNGTATSTGYTYIASNKTVCWIPLSKP